jgi:hypothetical protein
VLLNPFKRRDETEPLVVSMTGVKMGDQVAFIGCAHAGRLAAIASKVGLSGHAVAFVPDAAASERVSKGAANAGVLVEIEIASPMALPVERESFSLSVVDDTGDLLGGLPPGDRAALARELFRIVRPGGRVMIVGSTGGSGLGRLLSKDSGASLTSSGQVNALLESAGFRSVRTLAEREGLVFVEGIKARITGT